MKCPRIRAVDRSAWRTVGLALAVVGGLVWAAAGLTHTAAPAVEQTGAAAGASGQRLSGQVGIDAAAARWGDKTPTGSGIIAGHVEGNPGEYAPDLNAAALAGLKLTVASGPGKPSSHASATARVVYGSSGLAPGIREVTFMASQTWLEAGCLRTGTHQAPTAAGTRLYSHSWIGPGADYSAAVLRRLDYLVDTEDVLVVAGVNNRANTAVPALLGSAYNVIAVGAVNGDSSGGYTVHEGRGRCKPDLVAPGGLTSFATPVVTAVVARLLEAADRLKDTAPDARRSETIRAVLLAGAEKPAGWAPDTAAAKPLDEHLGAGQVRFDHSLAMLWAGQVRPGKITATHGWDFASAAGDKTVLYELTVAEDRGELSMVVAWNRRISGPLLDAGAGRRLWSDQPRLADFDLALVRVDGERAIPVATSASEVDNVEHIYLRGLAKGVYRFGVRRKDDLKEEWDYAIAWRLEPVGTTQPPAATGTAGR